MSVTHRSSDEGEPSLETRGTTKSLLGRVSRIAEAIRTNGIIRFGTSEDAAKTMQLVYRIYCADQRWKKTWNLSDDMPSETT